MRLSIAALLLAADQALAAAITPDEMAVAAVVVAETVAANKTEGKFIHWRSTKAQCWKGTSFPPRKDWLSFEQSWDVQHNSMLYGGDSSAELQAVKASILKYSRQSGVPAEFIYAVLMRESSGRVDTVCGDHGMSCGLMQVQGPKDYITCKKHPCSAEVIDRMIKCGTVGGCPGQTGSDLESCLTRYGGVYGAAARCYNTGSVPDIQDYTVAKYGTKQYVQDIANILLGAQSQEWISLDRQCFK